jgi:hypothetical protein
MDELKKIYYNPKTGFQSVDKTFQKVKHLGLTKSQVKKFIQEQAVAQILTAPKRKQNSTHTKQIIQVIYIKWIL